MGQRHGLRGCADQVRTRPQQGRVLADDLPQPATEPVANHSTTDPTADGVGDPRCFVGLTRRPRYRDRATPHPAALVAESLEGSPARQRGDQADSRARPLRRRAFTIARPARVDMR